ncbi:glycosyltransferase [Solimonas terrae]|uniref:Glycosyltransferase family 4 protein n=1 Tax=Solimonas terrae TaxID=1396819 RepID=A0A6M2BXW5_9GAMM|nr:glycosyltransferase [Solimonas terrae]NGY06963.1 glycosyltransferase family 4 protein [Solimonas terrae]
MPHLFAPHTRYRRDRRFRAIAAASDGVVVNSKDTARDVSKFLHVDASRILAMPFTPYAMPWWFDADPAVIEKRYDISGPYLLVCNHFWKHKDHATALRAFALMKEDSKWSNLRLVLTGDPIDHRDPAHYGRLLDLARSLQINADVKYLGLIPKRDQLALLRGCEALLQPTLFEGGPGGGSVYEAVGLGVRTVVSDIPVNREIDCGNISFFAAGDHRSLATAAAEMIATPHERPQRDELLWLGDQRLKHLARTIVTYLDGCRARDDV